MSKDPNHKLNVLPVETIILQKIVPNQGQLTERCPIIQIKPLTQRQHLAQIKECKSTMRIPKVR